ncbi:Rng2 calponin-homology domain, partial [Calocera cornea HHB12733]
RVDIHAYEYLCRVGEAKGWIEAAMGAEEGMDIPEWEEKMRDGVVLAKLVKGWGAEGKVFEHPKLQWRHSENFNIFLRYARSVGLPENFIFEFTDVYEKKNMPKVIYCIHGLSHLLARRGIAEDIGSLVGELEFSNDQLAAAQKGLNGVAMPNF